MPLQMWAELCMWLWHEVVVILVGAVAMVREWLYRRHVSSGEKVGACGTASGHYQCQCTCDDHVIHVIDEDFFCGESG